MTSSAAHDRQQSTSPADLLNESGLTLAARIRAGEVSSREVVDAHITCIEAVNPAINAVVRFRFDEARAEADAADAALASTPAEQLPPFHGVPCTIKETFALEGMPNSAGLLARKDFISETDAVTVTRFREAGAIPLGVTNTSELAMWMESVNRVYGRSKNPYDQTRLVGGSSGGEGAIIGAGASPFGLGSDVGGSIRGPCFFNGIFGHKATGGMIPNSGQYPALYAREIKMLTAGPMSRHAEDLMPLLRVLAGPDGADGGCVPMELGDPDSVLFEGRTLITVPDNGKIKVSADLMEAQQRAADALSRRGMKVKEMRFKGLEKQFDIWSATIGNERDESFGRMLKEGRRMFPGLELLKMSVGASNHTVMAALTALVEPVPDLLPRMNAKLVKMRERLRAEILEELGDGGMMLYPVYSTPAPRHGVPVWQSLILHMPFAYQGIINALEMPATAVPLGLNADGLPLGTQVIAAHGNDHLTIAAAMELEREFGGWVRPTLDGGDKS